MGGPDKFQPLEEEDRSIVEPSFTLTVKFTHLNYLLFFLIFGFGCAVFVMNTVLLSVNNSVDLVAPILDFCFSGGIALACIFGCLYSRFYNSKPCFYYFYSFLAGGSLLFLVAVIVLQVYFALNGQPIIGFILFGFLITIGVLLLITAITTTTLHRRATGSYRHCASSSSSCSSTSAEYC